MRNTIRSGMWAWLRGDLDGQRPPAEEYPRAAIGAWLMVAAIVVVGATIVVAWLLLMPPQQ